MDVNENLIKLIKLISSDAKMADEFSSKKTKEELYEYCISLVPGYSEKEFTEFMRNLSISFKNHNNMSKISEKDLENVSGGVGLFETLVSVLNAFQEGRAEGNKILGKLSSIDF